MDATSLSAGLRRGPNPLRGEAPAQRSASPLRLLFLVSAHNSLSQRSAIAAPRRSTDPSVVGRARPLIRQGERAIDWTADSTETVIRRIRAAEGHPGVLDTIEGEELHLMPRRVGRQLADELTSAPFSAIGTRRAVEIACSTRPSATTPRASSPRSPDSHECFFGIDRSYHEARSRFVYKTGAPCKVMAPAADNQAMELLRSAVTRVAA